ncbi:hypothetical protein HRJ35_06410 [Shewanella oneidensis MR-1]|uniref:Uncharacterized protein n=1 Tax=Shewanella oneidensis (strain ATCC 700550 / JCM 31522 / CIP 106686 / LMG 19005 / NCIMB 14063 / MR-1) TaxID=211586 RepID=Q8EIM6_SHEON|nr:hypothetical protein [Shewanella oneidensis]AAN53888.1 uncharacterized protein SO_0812 [Shewanella oneidensis MR-1]MDX5997285.1 hypothetical protein [Shewanella oneidensis]MEE2029055.1 hypothetical protein [Shewanella oneidensis]QKG95674.1 hypothetical protein HRJ35_06410 [Shewanella oneidensis MR-1]
MLINRSKLTFSVPSRGWGWLEVLFFTLPPILILSLAGFFITEGWQKWHLVNQLEVRGDVAIGRVIETEYRSERGSNGISRQRLVCLVEYQTAEGEVIRQWELDGVDCRATYQLVPPQGDTPGALVPNYAQSAVSYLPDSPTRASADLKLTRDLAKSDFGFGTAGLLLGLLVGYFCSTPLRICWAESRYIPILKYLGDQQDYVGIINLLETYRCHPAANILVWEAADHIGHCPELYPRFVELFIQMEHVPNKKYLESIGEKIGEKIEMISFYRLSSLGFHDLALAMLARSNQALSARTLATFVLMTRTHLLPLALTLSAEKLKALEALCYAKELSFGLEDEKQCTVDLAARIEYLLWLVKWVLDDARSAPEQSVSPVQALILAAFGQMMALQTLSLDSAQVIDKHAQALLSRLDTSHGFQRALRPIIESLSDNVAQHIQQLTFSATTRK